MFWGSDRPNFRRTLPHLYGFYPMGSVVVPETPPKKRGKGSKDPGLVLNRRPTGPGVSYLLFQLKLSLSFHKEKEKHRLRRS